MFPPIKSATCLILTLDDWDTEQLLWRDLLLRKIHGDPVGCSLNPLENVLAVGQPLI
jgi:hypothetical protein